MDIFYYEKINQYKRIQQFAKFKDMEFYKNGEYFKCVKIYNDTFIHNMRLHVAVWLFYNPQYKTIPKGYLIHHIDHDKTNNEINNLILISRKDHVSHHFKGSKLSEEHKMKLSKSISRINFSDDQIQKILQLRLENNSYAKIAKIFNVSISPIIKIIKSNLQ